MKNGVRTSYLVCKRLTRVTERSINSCFSDLSDSTESMFSIYHRVNRFFPKLIVKNLKDLKKTNCKREYSNLLSLVYTASSLLQCQERTGIREKIRISPISCFSD